VATRVEVVIRALAVIRVGLVSPDTQGYRVIPGPVGGVATLDLVAKVGILDNLVSRVILEFQVIVVEAENQDIRVLVHLVIQDVQDTRDLVESRDILALVENLGTLDSVVVRDILVLQESLAILVSLVVVATLAQ